MGSSKLPNELLLAVIELINDNATLRGLLLSSRLLHSIAEPHLYRDVEFKISPNTTDIDTILQRVELFVQAVSKHSHRLATHVESLRVPNPWDIRTILPSLVNLRRLAFTSTARPASDILALYKSLSPINQLTHLVWWHPVGDLAAFIKFVEGQAILEHLCIVTSDTAYLEEPIKISPDALPRLRSLTTFDQLAIRILPGREIRNLQIFVLDDHRFPLRGLSFCTVETLSCSIYDVGTIASFPNIRYLEINETDEAAAFEETLDVLRTVQSDTVEYISIVFDGRSLCCERDLLSPPEGGVELLKHLPKLQAVDVVLEWPTIGPSEFYRYRIGDATAGRLPRKIDRQLQNCFTGWGLWWEFCSIDELTRSLQ